MDLSRLSGHPEKHESALGVGDPASLRLSEEIAAIPRTGIPLAACIRPTAAEAARGKAAAG
jgi:hypothetical protein